MSSDIFIGLVVSAVCAVLIGCRVASFRKATLSYTAASLLPVVVAFGWYRLTAAWQAGGMPASQEGWQYVATAMWSSVAVPVSVLAARICRRRRASALRPNNSSKPKPLRGSA